MRLGVQLREPLFEHGNVIDDLLETAVLAQRAGVSSLWLAQAFEYDALSALTLIGREVPDIELGTAVVPTYPRHPIVMAQQALTVQAASGGRLTLGIGPSHRAPIEGVFGYSFDGAARHVAEYLDALLPALAGEQVDHAGATITARPPGPLSVPGASPCPVLLGAMGPRMLALAGARAAGTITSKAGPRTLAAHIVPSITAAAEAAGRPAPRVAACLPFCLTADADAAYERAVAEFGYSEAYPTYRAMLDMEGASRPADVALIGDERAVVAKLRELAAAGATDYCARIFGTDDERRAAVELLGSVGPLESSEAELVADAVGKRPHLQRVRGQPDPKGRASP